MNQRRKRIILLSAVYLHVLIVAVQANPNHLEPIPPYHPIDSGYGQTVFTSLIGQAWASTWMIERPSFSREYAVILYGRHEYDPNGTRSAERREAVRTRWVIEHVAPRKMIWGSKPFGDLGSGFDVQPTPDVEKHHAYITKDLAEVVQEAWWGTLALTRYAEQSPRRPDGTTLQFYCGGRFGETRSPGSGLPAQLAELGRKLGAIALSEERNRESLLKEADTLARQIAKDAEAEQLKRFGKKMPRLSQRR